MTNIRAKLLRIEKNLKCSFMEELSQDGLQLLKLIYGHRNQKFLKKIWQVKYQTNFQTLIDDVGDFLKKLAK